MKLTPKQYAEIFVNVVSKADKTAAERFSESFWMLIRENKQEKLFGSIMRHAKRIWNQRHQMVDVAATVSQSMNEEAMKHMSSQLETALGKKVNLGLEVDANIKGGVILQIDDSRYDASISGRLERLSRELQA